MGNSGLSFDTDVADADYTNPNGAAGLGGNVGIGIGTAVGAASVLSSGSGVSTASGSQRLGRSFSDGSEGVRGAGSEEEGDRGKKEGVQWWDRGADGAGGNAGGKLLAYEIPEHWWAREEKRERKIILSCYC